jgi:acetate kinase
MADAVLALNAGSSSIKFDIRTAEPGKAAASVAKGEIDDIASAPHFVARDAKGAIIGQRRWDHRAAAEYQGLLDDLLQWIDAHLGPDRLVAAGHRIVHGGSRFTSPVRIDDDILKALDALTPLAPLHQPHSLSPVRAIMSLRPGLPQVACFDTAFHHTLPAVVTRFGLPRAYAEEGVRRYGFHGLSYEYIAGALRETAPGLAAGKVIVAHLGNGASLCAMADGRSADTTMGFSVLDGLVMGTRCGALDPGVILYMLRQKHLDAAAIEDVLYKRSGLLGVSGISGDMRDLLDSADPHARQAVELFVFRIARQTAALTGTLGGLDGLVFTGGIGEHAAEIRAAVCARLAWLGVVMAPDANAAHDERIGAVNSRVDVRVIPTNEESVIVRHTSAVLGLFAQAGTPHHGSG